MLQKLGAVERRIQPVTVSENDYVTFRDRSVRAPPNFTLQEWFVAHLAVQDKATRDRLLYETLKPVVSG